MKAINGGFWVVLLLFGLALSTPMASADTVWTNVSASEVMTGVWGDDGNWNLGTPNAAEVAFLTNGLNSYVVNYNATDTAFVLGTLRMLNTAPYTVTLNVNAKMPSTVVSQRFYLQMRSGAIVNVNSGAGFYAQLGSSDLAGKLFVYSGATADLYTWPPNNYKKQIQAFVASSAVFNGSDYSVTPGGSVTIESGGAYNGQNIYVGDRWSDGLAVITNRGSFVLTRTMYVASAMNGNSSLRQAIVRMEGGLMRIGTQGADYYLGISENPNATGWPPSYSGYGHFVLSGGVVTNNILQMGCSLLTAAETRSANGNLTIQNGSFWNLKHALIGGFPTTIGAGSVGLTGNNLVATVNQSGGSFRSLSHVYVANGPSTGTLNLSGGTFTVSNIDGTATLYVGAKVGANVTLSGKGKIVLTGGQLVADHLVATNGADNSVIDFRSGTIEAKKTATLGAGSIMTVGDGLSPARLILGDGSASTFAAGLTINMNAWLDIGGTNAIGAATLTGNLVLEEHAGLALTFTAGTHDVLTVNGGVSLNDCDLSIALNFLPAMGQEFTIISNDGVDPVTGKFSAETIDVIYNGHPVRFQLLYNVGDGNDVVLVRGPMGTIITVK